MILIKPKLTKAVCLKESRAEDDKSQDPDQQAAAEGHLWFEELHEYGLRGHNTDTVGEGDTCHSEGGRVAHHVPYPGIPGAEVLRCTKIMCL